MLIGVVGCASDPTGIRLHVDSELSVPAELEAIRILIEPEGGTPGDGIGLDRTVVPGEDAELPIAIAPAGADPDHRVHVLVEPTAGPELGQPLEPFDALLAFEPDAVRDVYVRFPRPCELREGSTCGEPCDVDGSCGEGSECGRAEDCAAGPCETARCEDGRCVVEPDACDDGDPCTIDWCDAEGGCMHRSSTHDADGREVEGCPAT